MTRRRAIGPGGAMTSCPPPRFGGAVSFRLGSAMDRRRAPVSQVRGGCVGQPCAARYDTIRYGAIQHGTIRLGTGGGSRAPARLLSSGGRGPRGCSKPHSSTVLRAAVLPLPPSPPVRRAGPMGEGVNRMRRRVCPAWGTGRLTPPRRQRSPRAPSGLTGELRCPEPALAAAGAVAARGPSRKG